MMNSMGPNVFGFPLIVLLMLLSGVFYIICAAFVWRPFRQEKNELIGALFAFLVYQAISMFFMGLDMHFMEPFYGSIASLAVFIGSAYMLKFPLSPLSEKTRRISFLLILIVALGIFAWFQQSLERQHMLMTFTLWYDLFINGVIVGGFILALSLKRVGGVLRIKALGGGTGVVSCCVVANATMLGGALLTSSFFQFLAPVLIVGSLIYARRKQNAAPVVAAQ